MLLLTTGGKRTRAREHLTGSYEVMRDGILQNPPLTPRARDPMYKVLDLFCGAGGAAMGLHRAWSDAEIVGVDIHPQPRYPFTFVQADALRPPFDLKEFDFIWASPPCQNYSLAASEWRKRGYVYPDLVEPVREMLKASGMPYVIENVERAPLNNPVLLCGSMFGLKTYRHRLFESNQVIGFQLCQPHVKQVKMGRPHKEGDMISIAGHFPGLAYAKKAMGIDWMNKAELAEAIPPAYSEYIARQIRPRA
jgi:DNA (cytosine-5)-methyltransferase 1